MIAIAIVALGGFGWYGFVVPAATEIHAPAVLPSTITVTAMDTFSYAVSDNNEVANNTTITVQFYNIGTLQHTFSLSSVQGVAIPTTANYNATGWTDSKGVFHPFYVAATLNGGTNTTLTFPAPPTGWYEFICTEPGHFQQGMLNVIGFGVPAPSNLTGGGALVQVGWPVYVIAGTIVGLVVLALVLGFASGQRHGAKHEMPPERLGYPEPPTTPIPPPANAPPLPSTPPKPPGS